jgi:hypothetical protein
MRIIEICVTLVVIYIITIMFLAIYYGDKTENHRVFLPRPGLPTKVLIDFKDQDQVDRCEVLYTLVCKYMPWVHEVYFINYTSVEFRPDLDDHIPFVVHTVSPGTSLFQVLSILGTENDLTCNYFPLYDCVCPIKKVKLCDLYSTTGLKRCLGIDGYHRYFNIGAQERNISILLESSCYTKYENMAHYLIGENVAGNFISNQTMMEDIYLLHRNEYTQMNNHNWDKQFVRIFKSTSFPEHKVIEVLRKT